MSLLVNELRAGTVFQEDQAPWLVLKYTHTKMGRGGATIRVKVRNLKTGVVVEKSYNNGAKVEEADVSKRQAQFLYAGEQTVVFMEEGTYEQFEVPCPLLEESLKFLTAGVKVFVLLYEDKPIGVELPKNVTLKVTYAEPGVRGDTATAAYIKVTVETGATIMTPMFVKTGDIIRVDTRTGDYIERAN